MEDYYTLLNLPSIATLEQIKQSYRKLARKVHPEKNPHKDTTAAFQQLSRAWEHLGDPLKKQIYDAQRRAQERRMAAAAVAVRTREVESRRRQEAASLEALRGNVESEKAERAAEHGRPSKKQQKRNAQNRLLEKHKIWRTQGLSKNKIKKLMHKDRRWEAKLRKMAWEGDDSVDEEEDMEGDYAVSILVDFTYLSRWQYRHISRPTS
jgi:curved DNA-binding protein CbpA